MSFSVSISEAKSSSIRGHILQDLFTPRKLRASFLCS